MCNGACYDFLVQGAVMDDFREKRVLEVGSRYENGSVRPLVIRFLSPKEYIGVDIALGKFVDLILPAERLVEHFGPESFDVVICMEMLEHVVDWKRVVDNLKGVLRQGGVLFLTTRSRGFHYHPCPLDCWRFELKDLREAFADFDIEDLRRDPEMAGVLLRARKPLNYVSVSLDAIAVHSVILGRQTDQPAVEGEISFMRRLLLTILRSKARFCLPFCLLELFQKRT